jgi:hypothetical protein
VFAKDAPVVTTVDVPVKTPAVGVGGPVAVPSLLFPELSG